MRVATSRGWLKRCCSMLLTMEDCSESIRSTNYQGRFLRRRVGIHVELGREAGNNLVPPSLRLPISRPVDRLNSFAVTMMNISISVSISKSTSSMTSNLSVLVQRQRTDRMRRMVRAMAPQGRQIRIRSSVECARQRAHKRNIQRAVPRRGGGAERANR